MPTLSIDIEARLAQFQDGLNKVARDAGRTANSIDRAFSGLRSTLGALAGLAIGGSVIAQLKQAIDELAALNDGATQAGVSVESLSSLLNTLAPTGVGLEKIVEIAGKITKSMGQAETETSAQAKAFAALGIAIKDAQGNLRNADDILVDLSKALAQYKDDANKVAIAQALLGKTGAEYLPILGDLATRGRAAATATKEQAQAADDLADSIGDLNRQFTVFKQGLASAVIPTLLKLIEQFNAGIAAAGGFSNALTRYGLRIPKAPASELADLRDRRKELQAELEMLEAPQKSLRARGAALRGRTPDVVRSELAQLEKDVQYFQVLEQQLTETRQEVYDPRDRAARAAQNKPSAPGGFNAPDKSPAKLKETARQFEDFEARVNAAVARLIQDAPIVKAQELEAVIGRLNTLFQQGLNGDVYAGALEEALTGLVQNGVDATHALDILDNAFFELGLSAEAYDKIQKAIFRTTATVGQDGAAGLRDLADRWRDAIDPMREYARQLDEIKRLEGRGFLKPDEAARARAIVQDRANKELSGAADQTKDLTDAAKDLGITFSSAFEDAIVSGKSLRDVLSGLEQDIMRIVTRKLVTEPLANGLTNIIGSFMGSMGGGAPISASVPTFVRSEHGNVMTEFGPLKLRKYSAGGVARSPQLSMFGEGSTPEAYVPLPDGRTIPVTMQGGGGDVNITVLANDVESFRRSEGQIKARVAGWSAGAGRYR